MNCEEINELVKELAGVIRFHELETVDSKAAELLEQVDTLFEDISYADDEDMDEWRETGRQENMVRTTR